MSSAAATPLDFAALLSRNSRPARVTRLIPKEAYKEPDANEKRHDPVAAAAAKQEAAAVARDLEVSKLVMDLVSKTPAYARHVENGDDIIKSEWMDQVDKVPKQVTHEWETLPKALHEVELGDWEKNIRWGNEDDIKPDAAENLDAAALLGKRRNPYLDALVFDKSNINWEGSREDAMEKARNVPLILELGTAGQSIARHMLPVSRPAPFGQSKEYMQRMEREWASDVKSSAEVAKGATLHADRDQMEAMIEARQKKRAQLEKEKSKRVTEVMGTLGLGAGRGRTITSSLMGPGGAERTGRPTRFGGTSTHDMEYIEQLDLVYNYTLVKPDLRKVELRQYHRPRLPLSVVRKDRPWQLQIRYIASSKKTDPNNNVASYQSMIGGHAGATSQAKIRTEADLSPSEGDLVLLEYCEERPPIQLTKGMASKIVNFYRGDRSKCPVSAGGGDRPTRKRRENTGSIKDSGSSKVERPPRLIGPNEAADTTLTDWIGKPPKKTSRDDRSEKPSVDVLPEGVTEILHTKVHGPFIGEVEDGATQTGLISNMFVAPMFRHESESTDFLMILGKKPSGGSSRAGGSVQPLGVVLRPLPTTLFTVGQVEPRIKVFAPNTQGERNFTQPFISYQIAKALTRTEQAEGHGLRFDEIQDHLFANTPIQANALRQRVRNIAVYDKNSQIWTAKQIGEDDYPGVEALGRKFTPEGVAAYEMECSATRRLTDLGIHEIFAGASSVPAVGLVLMYLTGEMNAAREIYRKMKKAFEFVKMSRKTSSTQISLYQKASEDLEAAWKDIRRKHEVARFIYEELQLAPWHLTSEFIDVHKSGQGTGMMQLTGLGDPSGLGEGYSFLREADTKPNKMGSNNDGALNAQIKKITGTQNDLRKLTMKQMASLLRSYGLAQKEIDKLKRWDRVHVIRDLSTKAASDGMGDGLERFARGEKMRLSDQKRVYQARIQEIWRRQRAALSSDTGDSRVAGASGDGISSAVSEVESTLESSEAPPAASKPDETKETEDSDSDSDDDDFAAMLEEDLKDVKQTNQLVAEQIRGATGDEEASRSLLGQKLREGGKDLSKDARELAALKRQIEEERAAHEDGIGGVETTMTGSVSSSMIGKKVVRRRIVKKFPDGRQTTTFKFVLAQPEVDRVLQHKKETAEQEAAKKKKYVYKPDSRPVGHAIFEDEDDVDHHRSGSGIRLQVQRRAVPGTSGFMRAPSRSHRGAVQVGKLKQRVSHEKRLQKRKREEEEADLYVAASKRLSTTSDRKHRGSIRDRMPHVKLADKLESIRAMGERKPGSEPFHRPVNRKAIPRYYEVIHDPIDLQTIQNKNQRYEYKTADAFLRDFELMKRNAAKFNGAQSIITGEANSLYDFVKAEIENERAELTELEEAVKEQLSGKKKKKRKKAAAKAAASAGPLGRNVVVKDGVAVDLGDLTNEFNFNLPDSDSD